VFGEALNVEKKERMRGEREIVQAETKKVRRRRRWQ